MAYSCIKMSIKAQTRTRLIAFGLALAVSATWVARADADEVRILRSDGSNVTGVLTAFEDGVYVITTAQGEVRVEVGRVVKLEVLGAHQPPASAGLSPAPPVAAPAVPETADTGTALKAPAMELSGASLSFSGSQALGEMAIRQLVEAYALRNGANKPVWGQRNAGNDRTFVAQTGKDKTFTADVRLRGTAGGIEDLLSGAAEIAMLERPMTDEEAKRVAAAGFGDPLQPGQETIIGPSAAIALVHPTNPVKRLSLAQLSDIFAGRIRNWSEVGGGNRRIQLLVPKAGSAIFDAMQAGTGKEFEILPSARRVASSLETADLVGADPAAIGLAHSDYRGNTSALSLTTACGLTYEPNEFQIASETYPFGNRLVLYTTDRASKYVRDFLAFAQSSEAQRLLHEKGLVSLTPVLSAKGAVKFDRAAATKMTGASPKFSDVAGAFVERASRLSLTFRFDAQATALDARGQADLDRLAEFAKSGALNNRTLALVGYWDNTGDFTDDVSQSKARAVKVADWLKQKGLNIESLFGFGPLLPVACEGTSVAKHRNRRVEVWVE